MAPTSPSLDPTARATASESHLRSVPDLRHRLFVGDRGTGGARQRDEVELRETNFEPLSRDNRLVLTMEWVAEGLLLVFIGVLALFVTTTVGHATPGATVVYRTCAGMLLVLARDSRIPSSAGASAEPAAPAAASRFEPDAGMSEKSAQ